MKSLRRARFALVGLGLVALGLLSGCAPKLPATVALNDVEKAPEQARLEEFLARQCPIAVDADATLRWEFSGQKVVLDGMLQALEPGMLRYTVTDPLGRTLFILAVNGETFIFIDTGETTAHTGALHADYWQERFPHAVLLAADPVGYLSGTLPAGEIRIKSIERERQGDCCWYVLESERDDFSHHVRLDAATNLISRHALLDGDGDIVLDIRYVDYLAAPGEACPWPGEITVSGQDVTGEAALDFVRIISHDPPPEKIFNPAVPPHYILRQVN